MIAPTHPRLWWSLAGLLLLLLLFPLRPGRAQGLQSRATSVSLVAVKQDPAAAAVRDFTVDVPVSQRPVVVAVRLLDDVDAPPLFVRDSTGRFARVTRDFQEIGSGQLRLRAVALANRALGTATWDVEVRTVDAAGRTTRSTKRLENR